MHVIGEGEVIDVDAILFLGAPGVIFMVAAALAIDTLGSASALLLGGGFMLLCGSLWDCRTLGVDRGNGRG